jgi:geranylgeranyl diphosphate synthase type I
MPELSECLSLAQDEMRAALSPDGGEPAEFYGSMRYALGWADESFEPTERRGGKRLRPRLCLLCCLAAGGDPRAAAPAAAAIELLHNFSLVHDDIQDDSPQRHHRPSVWSLIGVPLAINTGDGLYAAAHLALSRLGRSVSAPELVTGAFEEFDRTALRICEGQHMDLLYVQRHVVTSEEYLRMIARKTGALFGLACGLGALVAGADAPTRDQYRLYGERLGAAYQIRDDLQGVWRDPASTGKRAMEDIYSRKKAYAAVRAFEISRGDDAARLRSIYAEGPVSEQDAAWVRELMGRLGVHEEGEAKVRECAAGAVEALAAAGASGPAADDLRAVAEGLLS